MNGELLRAPNKGDRLFLKFILSFGLSKFIKTGYMEKSNHFK